METLNHFCHHSSKHFEHSQILLKHKVEPCFKIFSWNNLSFFLQKHFRVLNFSSPNSGQQQCGKCVSCVLGLIAECYQAAITKWLVYIVPSGVPCPSPAPTGGPPCRTLDIAIPRVKHKILTEIHQMKWRKWFRKSENWQFHRERQADKGWGSPLLSSDTVNVLYLVCVFAVAGWVGAGLVIVSYSRWNIYAPPLQRKYLYKYGTIHLGEQRGGILPMSGTLLHYTTGWTHNVVTLPASISIDQDHCLVNIHKISY